MTVNVTLTEGDVERLLDGEVIKVTSATRSTVSLAMVCGEGEHNWSRYSVQGNSVDGSVTIRRRCSQCKDSEIVNVDGDELFD